MTKDEMTAVYSFLVVQQSQILHLTQQVAALRECLKDRDITIQTSYQSALVEIQKRQEAEDKKPLAQATSGPGALLRELRDKLGELSNPEG